MDIFCEVCGNEIPVSMLTCKYCGTKQQFASNFSQKSSPHRVINLEIGKPMVEDALAKFDKEINRARLDKVSVVTIIHGYGSSGRGGSIRTECRKALEFLESKNQIRGFIAGEEFSKKQRHTRSLLRRIPELATDCNLNRNNRGVTIVEL